MALDATLSALQKLEHISTRLLADFPQAPKEWSFQGRLEQMPPEGDWRTWLLMGGRGSGKTRAGAEWVHAVASADARGLRIALVAETLGDAREVMIDGISGICRIARRNRPEFEISRRQAGLAERGGGADLLVRGSGKPARAAISTWPGATSWRNGSMGRRPGTCCNSA